MKSKQINPKRVFKLGTRSSPLALWQADRVSTLLKQFQPDIQMEIIKITTSGDKILDKPLVQVGGKGIFTKEIEEAMQREEIDFAVHSFKDLPTVLPDGLEVTCIPERSSPFDALFSPSSNAIRGLPKNPTIATGSLRRKAQILYLRPDAEVVDIRGNVNTRLKKYEEAGWDGFIMAHAAVVRMEWEDKVHIISPKEILPPPAQGALAIECRSDDDETKTLLAAIHNKHIAPAVWAERSFLSAMEGGCQIPLAAYAGLYGNCLALTGLISALDGKESIRQSVYGSSEDPYSLGKQLAETILQNGGEEIKTALIHANDTLDIN